jgi:hypothetical protein
MARLVFCLFASMVSICGLCSRGGLSKVPVMNVLSASEAESVMGGSICSIDVISGNGCPGASGYCGYWGSGSCPADPGDKLVESGGNLESASLDFHDCAVGTCGVKCGRKKVTVHMTQCVGNATGAVVP